MAKRPLPNSGKARNMTVNQFTVSKAVNFPELQAAVVSATGGKGNGGGKKDDTVTKDEFNSGFQDGVSQIKDGFSSLGVGLGPLQLIVDFVKGFASKIGNIFTIFKGFFNILLSIPKAIANAFKKKDKEDDKKDKKKGKLKGALEKGKKKERDKDRKDAKKGRGGFLRFATALKPVLILGAILAISTGLIMLYNWLVGKGLFAFFDNLLTGIRIGLLDLKAGFALVFKGEKSEEFKKLQAEKAELIIEKKVLKNLSDEDKEFLASDQNSAEAKNLRIQQRAIAEGADRQGVMTALESESGTVREILKTEFNLDALDALKFAQFQKEGVETALGIDTELVTKNLGLDTRLTNEGQFGSIKNVDNFGPAALTGSTEEIYGSRVFTTKDGDLTKEMLFEELKTQRPELTMEKVEQMIMTTPGMALAPDGNTILQTNTGGADSEGLVKMQRNEVTGDLETADLPGGSLSSNLMKVAIDEDNSFLTRMASAVAWFNTNLPGITTTVESVINMTGLNDIEGELLDAQAEESANKDIVNQVQAKKELETMVEIVQDEYFRDALEKAGVDGERIGASNTGKIGKEKDQALIEDLNRFSEVDGDASNLSRMFRRDSFEFDDGTNMNSAQIEESLVARIQSSLELTNREDAQIIYNTYMDNNQNMIQNIAPTSDTGQSTSNLYFPDVANIP